MYGIPIKLSIWRTRAHFDVSFHCINHLCFEHMEFYTGRCNATVYLLLTTVSSKFLSKWLPKSDWLPQSDAGMFRAAHLTIPSICSV